MSNRNQPITKIFVEMLNAELLRWIKDEWVKYKFQFDLWFTNSEHAEHVDAIRILIEPSEEGYKMFCHALIGASFKGRKKIDPQTTQQLVRFYETAEERRKEHFLASNLYIDGFNEKLFTWMGILESHGSKYDESNDIISINSSVTPSAAGHKRKHNDLSDCEVNAADVTAGVVGATHAGRKRKHNDLSADINGDDGDGGDGSVVVSSIKSKRSKRKNNGDAGADAVVDLSKVASNAEEVPDDDAATLESALKIVTNDKNENNEALLILKFSIPMTHRLFYALGEHQMLNDEVINFYMEMHNEREYKKKMHKERESYFFPSTFITQLMDCRGGYQYTRVNKWSTKYKINLFALDKVFFPICKNKHWTLIIIFIQQKKICYFDSSCFAGYFRGSYSDRCSTANKSAAYTGSFSC